MELGSCPLLGLVDWCEPKVQETMGPGSGKSGKETCGLGYEIFIFR